MAIGATVGALIPFALVVLRQVWVIDVSNYSRYESIVLALWPSSLLLLPFEQSPLPGIALSVLINVVIYSTLLASVCMYLRSRSFSWLALPSLFILYGAIVLKGSL